MADADARRTGLAADERRAALMAAAQAGDGAAYQALLRDCISIVQAIARRQGVPADRIDDVVQETLLSVHRARHTYDPQRPFIGWLRAIAQRRAIDVLRSTGRHGRREVHAPLAYESFPDAAAPDRDAERAQAGSTIAPAIAALPAGQREAVQRLVLEERSLAEAAVITGRKPGALKVNLHRALKTLRAKLGGGEG
ncbi:MAG TPA: sigma-70 family RNA polymerase sigma factor [Alphaproteobacteria bacterium]